MDTASHPGPRHQNTCEKPIRSVATRTPSSTRPRAAKGGSNRPTSTTSPSRSSRATHSSATPAPRRRARPDSSSGRVVVGTAGSWPHDVSHVARTARIGVNPALATARPTSQGGSPGRAVATTRIPVPAR